MSSVIERDIYGDNNIESFMQGGKKVELINHIDGKKSTVTISASMYKDAINREMTKYSDYINNTEITDENRKDFIMSFDRLQLLKEKSKLPSPIESKYEGFYNTKTGSALSISETKKRVEYINWKLATNRDTGVYKHLESLNNTVMNILGDDTIEDSKKQLKIQSEISNSIRDKQFKVYNKDMIKKISTELENISTGEGLWTVAFNTEMPIGMNSAVSQHMYATGSSDVKSFIESRYETVDIGYGFYAPDYARLLVPSGYSARQFEDALDKLIENHDEDLDGEKLDFVPYYDEQTKNLSYTVKKFGEDKVLFSISANDIPLLESK